MEGQDHSGAQLYDLPLSREKVVGSLTSKSAMMKVASVRRDPSAAVTVEKRLAGGST